MSWTDYSSAPAPGTVICPADQVTGVLAVTVTSDRGQFPVLVLRQGDGIGAFVNACPHQYLPLDYRGDQLLSADGTALLCTAHGARFDRETGQNIAGADCGLDPVPVRIEGGNVVIAA
ncbi:Rieske (2Fe-2S) protein [Paracoccus homiensis]|uniref:Ferredoxin subunit of nitrite reductase or a ring-hydroxylating dioxygenase n=1 Tax=Paracoccus homiensis TaxID=364199 RepID=A0A1I0DJX0_9RHOB|nr:Rieske 2Fe-2S domain-containing protein [Paracoccus homiensis]SET32768.1 Ferredoxin subunit of nitrite reductase or a ring-hydroxylating dioxygenase [Paracoccus homiensis]